MSSRFSCSSSRSPLLDRSSFSLGGAAPESAASRGETLPRGSASCRASPGCAESWKASMKRSRSDDKSAKLYGLFTASVPSKRATSRSRRGPHLRSGCQLPMRSLRFGWRCRSRFSRIPKCSKIGAKRWTPTLRKWSCMLVLTSSASAVTSRSSWTFSTAASDANRLTSSTHSCLKSSEAGSSWASGPERASLSLSALKCCSAASFCFIR
mmetsp:Transcript_57278/g.148827  ORF Transcript_57278/g.148827 Transcript_57278/m.148827 type:complete len:210 (-) Transcript_57278:175-804(-)